MQDIQKLEAQYLRAKIEYYEGTPIMEDQEFDALEKILKEAGSKVHEQVGSKRKDFDFAHPTKMLSLSKEQTERIDGVTDYRYDEFFRWFDKRVEQLGARPIFLSSSPKFDGSAINIIYKGKELFQVLTRGDGAYGKDVTKRFRPHIPNTLSTSLPLDETDNVEIRCEVVIDKTLFEQKYAEEFANPRNYVAGVIGKDDYDKTKVSELVMVPLHFLVNGEHVKQSNFKDNTLYSKNYNIEFGPGKYIDEIIRYEEMRNDFPYWLDGVVISFPEMYRSDLGENDHDPEWAIAIKFVPEGAVTTVNGIEWNIGKRGQMTPVVLLDPVQLVGTTVKRASGYNAGYLKNNGIGVGAIVSIAKAGDIIPEIQNIVSETTETFVLPHQCHECGTSLTFDEIHLLCPNEKCPGKIAKILAHGSGVLDLKNVGSERLKPFAEDFENILQVWHIAVTEPGSLGKYGLEPGTRLHEIFVQAFVNIKSIPYEKVIQCLGFENVGRKITQQLAKEHAGLDFSYASLERALVDKMHTEEVESYIKYSVSKLEDLDVTVDRPKAPSNDGFGVVMTGSPKSFGFKTKKEFLEKFPHLYEVSMSDKTCKFLVTDNLSSTSGKMKAAEKKGIEIKTYGDF